MRFIIGILFFPLWYCIANGYGTEGSLDKIDDRWVTYNDTLVDAGFILTFKHPNDLVLADIIDNCRCVGKKNVNTHKNKATNRISSRQWCICMHDSVDYSIDSLISSWKSIYNGNVIEQRDTITFGNLKALQVILKSKTETASFKHLIYLDKYSTLFEIINIDETSERDFETFYKSISIMKYSKSKR